MTAAIQELAVPPDSASTPVGASDLSSNPAAPPWAFLEQEPCWKALRYPALHVTFPEGSTFELPAAPILWQAAVKVAIPGMSPATHLREQLLPLLAQNPAFLIEFARGLSWSAVRPYVAHAHWLTPADIHGATRWQRAGLILSTYQPRSGRRRAT